jgi:hypothetical protein
MLAAGEEGYENRELVGLSMETGKRLQDSLWYISAIRPRSYTLKSKPVAEFLQNRAIQLDYKLCHVILMFIS